jgi:hypothetical protein
VNKILPFYDPPACTVHPCVDKNRHFLTPFPFILSTYIVIE